MQQDPYPDWLLEHCRALGDRIRDARNAAKLTQEELAERTDTSWRSIHRIEHGFPGAPVSLLLRIARVLRVPARDLLG